MNKNGEKKTMPSRTTLVNLYQGSNEKMRKTHRSICHKGIQKCTSLNRNGVQVKDGLDGMTRNPEKQVMNLGQPMRGNPRISTPLNESIGEIWHNVIKRRGLIIRVHRLRYLRYPKSKFSIDQKIGSIDRSSINRSSINRAAINRATI